MAAPSFLQVCLGNKVSNITLGKNLLMSLDWGKIAEGKACLAIITDSNLEERIAKPFKTFLEKKGYSTELFSFPAGEKSKTREMKIFLEDAMIEKAVSRNCLIIGIGGGVTLDLAGFIAATYCRGIPWVAVSTSLLAMVDVIIGGKVGVNTPYAKNYIGAFYPPTEAIVDVSFLQTLPKEEWLNGIAEMVKHTLLSSKEGFFHLTSGMKELAFSLDKWEDWIYESLLIKKRIVEKDPFERGLRSVLNLGHTIGHAIESACDFTISHGKAVAIALSVELQLSYLSGFLSQEEKELIEEETSFLRKDLRLPDNWDEERFRKALLLDKKNKGKQPRFVLLEAIGKVHEKRGEFCFEVEEAILEKALSWMIASFQGALCAI